MELIDKWFQNSKKKLSGSVFLEEAILDNNIVSYGYYRLRYFIGRLLVLGLIHIVEFLFLINIFEFTVFIYLLALKFIALAIGSFIWGALETLRSEVRDLNNQKKNFLVPQRLSIWFLFGSIWFFFTLFAGITYLFIDLLILEKNFSLIHLYLISIIINLSLDFPISIFHSGVYAVRRIFRPFWSLVVGQTITFLGTIILWPHIQQWSFPLMSIVGVLIGRSITVFFVNRLYVYFRFYPTSFPSKEDIKRFFRFLNKREFFSAGFASMLMGFEFLIPMTIFVAKFKNVGFEELFVSFFLLKPFFEASSDWCRLFYFDFKKLDLDLFIGIKKRLFMMTVRFSVVITLALWALSVLVLYLFSTNTFISLVLAILPIFIVRSFIGIYQIEAFTSRNYKVVIYSSLLIIVASYIMSLLIKSIDIFLVNLLFILLLSLLFLIFKRRVVSKSIIGNRFPEWLKLLKKTSSCRIGLAKIPENYSSWFHNKVAKELTRKIRKRGRAVLLQTGYLIWYQTDEKEVLDIKDFILRASAGMIEEVHITEYHENYLYALEEACSNIPLLKKLLDIKHGGVLAESNTLDELTTEFKKFKNSSIFDVNVLGSANLSQITSDQKREIIRKTIEFVVDPISSRVGRYLDAVAYLNQNGIQVIFISLNPKNKEYLHWRDKLIRANLTNALN